MQDSDRLAARHAAQLKRGYMFLGSGDVVSGRKVFQRLSRNDPSDIRARVGMAVCKAMEGDLQNGLREVEAFADRLTDANSLLWYAELLQWAGRTNLAVERLIEAIAADGSLVSPYVRLAELYIDGRRQEEAAEILVHFPEGNERRYWKLKAYYHEVFGTEEECLDALHVVLGFASQKPDERDLLAVATSLSNLHRYDEALDVLSLCAATTNVLALQAHIAINQKRYGDAVALVQRMTDMGAAEGEVLQLLGVIAYRQGEFEVAVEALRQSLDMDASFAPTWHTLARSLARLKRFEEAEEAVVKAIELRPRYEDALNLYKFIAKKLGREVEASSTGGQDTARPTI